MHVRLPEREGVDVRGRVQVRETVVHESVGGFIRPDSIQNVEELRVWTQTPIVDGNFWSFEISPISPLSATFTGILKELTIPEFFRLPSL